MALIEAECLTLRVYESGDTSQVAHLLASGAGKIHVLAKGSRRDRNSFQGALDMLVHGRAGWYPRPRTGLHLLGTFEVLETFPRTRCDLDRYYLACHVLQSLHEATRQEDQGESAFRLGLATLRFVEMSNEPARILPVFHADLLRQMGSTPRLDACVVCGKDAPSIDRERLSPVHGGLVCETCSAADRFAFDLSPGVRDWMEALLVRPFREALRLDLPASVSREVAGTLVTLLQHTLERDLPTLRWVRARS